MKLEIIEKENTIVKSFKNEKELKNYILNSSITKGIYFEDDIEELLEVGYIENGYYKVHLRIL